MADADAGADQELIEDAASAHQDFAQPLKAEPRPEQDFVLTIRSRMREKRGKLHQPEDRFRAQGYVLCLLRFLPLQFRMLQRHVRC